MLTRPTTSTPVTPSPLIFSGEEEFAAAVVRTTLTSEAADQGWSDDVLALLRPHERALVSLAFTPGGPAVAHVVAPAPLDLDSTSIHTPYDHRTTTLPSEADYADQVRAALSLIADGTLDKVVLGRCLDVISTPALRPYDIAARLLEARPGRYIFSLPLGPDADGSWLVGASPELLVRRHGLEISSTPLAGSVPRSLDPHEDQRRAAALQESAKDLAEHAFVVEDIVATLRPVCADVEAPATPRLLSTDTMWHLATPIRARLHDSTGPSALRLAHLLNPTPAVGGVPLAPALSAITDLEGDLRGPLAGAVGWVDSSGDGEFAIAIRSGVVTGQHLRLFAGAGIVAGSDPESEVRETGAKLATMSRVVGL